MVTPVKHDIASSTSTALWETAKGGLLGVVAAVGGGAVVGGLLATGAAALVGAVTIGVGAALASTGVLVGIGVAALAGGLFGAGFAVPAGLVGGALGAMNGGSKISRESQAYQHKMALATQPNGPSAAAQAGLQQGYQMGFHDGQTTAVNQIQQAIVQEAMAQKAAAGGFAAKCGKCPSGTSQVDALGESRKQAAASAGLGA